MLYIIWTQYQVLSIYTKPDYTKLYTKPAYTKPAYTKPVYTILLSYIMVAVIGMTKYILYYCIFSKRPNHPALILLYKIV